jgi:hypothetical protein
MINRISFFILFLVSGLIFQDCSTFNHTTTEKNASFQPADKVLYHTIAQQDSLLFMAFNNRNLDGLMNFFSKNLEIYQDNKGLRNYDQARDGFGSLFQKDYVLSRQLVKGSMEVYPIKDYGAIETGNHTFCHTENGRKECATFKFMNIWHWQGGEWKITRLITYDH